MTSIQLEKWGAQMQTSAKGWGQASVPTRSDPSSMPNGIPVPDVNGNADSLMVQHALKPSHMMKAEPSSEIQRGYCWEYRWCEMGGNPSPALEVTQHCSGNLEPCSGYTLQTVGLSSPPGPFPGIPRSDSPTCRRLCQLWCRFCHQNSGAAVQEHGGQDTLGMMLQHLLCFHKELMTCLAQWGSACPWSDQAYCMLWQHLEELKLSVWLTGTAGKAPGCLSSHRQIQPPPTSAMQHRAALL